MSSLMIFWHGVGHNVLVGVGFTIKATTLRCLRAVVSQELGVERLQTAFARHRGVDSYLVLDLKVHEKHPTSVRQPFINPHNILSSSPLLVSRRRYQ
jgi:hypothetical protein